jgi:hypothetical protein
MHRISPGGFAIALALLVVIWIFLPNAARLPLAIVLVFGALAASKAPEHTIDRFFALLK